MSTKTYYDRESRQISTEISDKFGGSTNNHPNWKPENYTTWISIGGPVKGSYMVREGKDLVTDWGLRVDDPCKAVDNLERISMKISHTAYRDLRYHDGTNSTYWL